MAVKKGKRETKVDPERQEALEALPPSIRSSLTEEEVELFLHAEQWPESMFEKLSEFIRPE
ncbi:MAG: hypothetical protein MI742_00775 [Desulfobacterales bacterium]|nr:hypothetical protein [Desulfobacterales bacterium]